MRWRSDGGIGESIDMVIDQKWKAREEQKKTMRTDEKQEKNRWKLWDWSKEDIT